MGYLPSPYATPLPMGYFRTRGKRGPRRARNLTLTVTPNLSLTLNPSTAEQLPRPVLSHHAARGAEQ